MNDIENLKPFPKFCYSIGYIPTSYKVSMTYEEQLVWLCDYIKNTVIPTINNNSHVVEELQYFVEHYFDNLDVQTEINNKLDAMVLDGTLAEVINEQLFDELDDKITNLETEVNNIEKTELVIFGDSWTAPSVTDAIWGNIVANNLNLNLHNYASNGAGFVSPVTNLISTQVTTFLADDTYEKEKVKFIIILGGINDYKNSIGYDVLGNAIHNVIEDLQEECPDAKILYVSNCEAPRTRTQSNFWINVHNYLSTADSIGTLNLDDFIGIALYNTSNYFHLTQNGQKFMSKLIISALTGGELTPFRDQRIVEDDYIRLVINTQKIGNMAHNNILVYFKQAFTSDTLTLDSSELDFPYYDNSRTYSASTRPSQVFDYRIERRSFIIASADEFTQGYTAIFDCFTYLPI